MMPLLDVIIVNWNTGPRLKECLSALASARHDGYSLGRVIIVDNASADDSADDLSYPSLPLVLVQNSSNIGFGAACNQAATGSIADYLLFLNPDTRVIDCTLARSIEWMEAPQNSRTGIIGVQLLEDDGGISRSCSRFLATRHFIARMLGLDRLFPTVFPDFLYLDWDHLESRQIEHVMGAYFFMRRRTFEAVDGFDERFFVYYEDVDLSLRALQAGWSSCYLADVQCYHACGGSSDQIKALRLFYSLRSRIFYAFKNFSMPNAVTLLLATLLVEPASRLVQAVCRRSIITARETITAYMMLWNVLPRMLTSKYLLKRQPLKLHPRRSCVAGATGRENPVQHSL
jgi:GT2 family glycosyltransferase